MKIRYEDNLTYYFDIPDEMNQIIVPMLIIQPLVENSIKYGLNTSPPWNISVSGEINGNRWKIEISDNGPGFDPLVLNEFNHFIETSIDSLNVPDLQINGMGLKNIYFRLKLLYQNDTFFELQNHGEKGVSVTIGGLV